jgi:hypothetical protein
MYSFQWPYQGGALAAEFAELVVGLLLTGVAIEVMAHRRASARARVRIK